jgi:hypothetical protein
MSMTSLLTQQKLEQILVTTFFKVQESEKINIIDLIEEIKQQIISEKE